MVLDQVFGIIRFENEMCEIAIFHFISTEKTARILKNGWNFQRNETEVLIVETYKKIRLCSFRKVLEKR